MTTRPWNHESGVFTCGTCDGLQVVASQRRGTVDDPCPEVRCPDCIGVPVECQVCGNDLDVTGYDCLVCDTVNELPDLDDAAACEFANSIIRACAAKRAFGKASA